MEENSEQARIGSAFELQPKEYKHIKCNKYLKKKKREDDDMFCSCPSSPESHSVCRSNCLCLRFEACCSSSCKCGSSCGNKAFQFRPVKKLKLVLTEKCGFGIAAGEDIKQGDFVIEYVGEVIDHKTYEDRLRDMNSRGETNFYFCQIARDMVIDAKNMGNKSRFMNHSCCPNTEMRKRTIDGEFIVGIFATRDIQKGEHLTFNYGHVPLAKDQDCYCGAVGCKFKLGALPVKLKMSSDASQTEICCYGIVADEDIKPGDFIIEYVREVIDHKTCEERLWDINIVGKQTFTCAKLLEIW